VEFRGAGHLAWTDLNPRFQQSMAAYGVAFFDQYLKDEKTDTLTSKRADVSVLRSK